VCTSQTIAVIACNCRPVIGHLCLDGRTRRCDARRYDRVLGRRSRHPLCLARARPRSVAIAIFQLVAGDAAKMHYRSARRRASWRTRRRIIWMNVAQMNGCSGDTWRHFTRFLLLQPRPVCARQLLLLDLFVLLIATCMHRHKSLDCSGRHLISDEHVCLSRKTEHWEKERENILKSTFRS